MSSRSISEVEVTFGGGSAGGWAEVPERTHVRPRRPRREGVSGERARPAASIRGGGVSCLILGDCGRLADVGAGESRGDARDEVRRLLKSEAAGRLQCAGAQSQEADDTHSLHGRFTKRKRPSAGPTENGGFRVGGDADGVGREERRARGAGAEEDSRSPLRLEEAGGAGGGGGAGG
ncbi:MAG: hypothetical protein SGPRY_008920 [Prymnesium sp.]